MRSVTERAYDAVLFDLLTALIDSWSLWNAVSPSAEAGLAWRARYLKFTYEAKGSYRPYEDLVREAADAVGLPKSCPDALLLRWDELEPWPEVTDVLRSLSLPLGVVTNCSNALGTRAMRRVPVSFAVAVTAERAGAYKPSFAPYGLALHELKVPPKRVLFVAGSAYDIAGASAAGMPVFWHNRINMPNANAPLPLREERSLTPLRDMINA